MAAWARAGPGGCQEPGTSSVAPIWVSGASLLGPSSAAFPGTLLGSWTGRGVRTWTGSLEWDVSWSLGCFSQKFSSFSHVLDNWWVVFSYDFMLLLLSCFPLGAGSWGQHWQDVGVGIPPWVWNMDAPSCGQVPWLWGRTPALGWPFLSICMSSLELRNINSCVTCFIYVLSNFHLLSKLAISLY